MCGDGTAGSENLEVIKRYHCEQFPGLRKDNHYELRLTPEAYAMLLQAVSLLIAETDKMAVLGSKPHPDYSYIAEKVRAQLNLPPSQ